jgi:hypothetical protein
VAVVVERQMVLAAQAQLVKVMLVGEALLMGHLLHLAAEAEVQVAQVQTVETPEQAVMVVTDNHHQLVAHPSPMRVELAGLAIHMEAAQTEQVQVTRLIEAVVVQQVRAVQALLSSKFPTPIVRHSLAVLPTLYLLQAQT